jgi:hypothetical protein
VRRGTAGRGADLVLNSLAGDKLQARARPLRACTTLPQRLYQLGAVLYV